MTPNNKPHPTTPQNPTSYPMPNSTSPYLPTSPPPSPIPSPPIHRDPPNIKNTLLMSDPLYRPSNPFPAASHLFGHGTLHPYPALENEYEDDEDEENWIDDSTPEKDAERCQQKNALPAQGRGSGSGDRDRGEGRGSPGKGRRRSARIGVRMREARRSGSPPAHQVIKDDIRRRDDHRYTEPRLRGRSEAYETERAATESRPSRGPLKNGGGGRARGGYESDGPDDLGGESTGYWGRREDLVRGVRGRGRNRGAPENGRFGRKDTRGRR